MDLEDIEYVLAGLKFRGAQGTTGTQASFMEIFHGDTAKIDRLNEILCEKAGFEACYDISTQTYTRKVDLRIANALSAFGASAIRIATVRKPSRSLCRRSIAMEGARCTGCPYEPGTNIRPYKALDLSNIRYDLA